MEYFRLLKGNLTLLYIGLGGHTESGNRWVTLLFRCGTCNQTVGLYLDLAVPSYEELGRYDFYQLLADRELELNQSRHILTATHWNVWVQRGERISAIMGLPRATGVAVRHQSQVGEVSPYGYHVNGAWVFSPSQQGCPLPTKECVGRYLGRVPNLIPALVAALRLGRAKLEIRGDSKKAKSALILVDIDQVESIRVEFVFWDMNKMSRQYDASGSSGCDSSDDGPRRVNCLPFNLLFDADRDYFAAIVGELPREGNWHPEAIPQEAARFKADEGEALTPYEKKQVFWQAATENEAWYPIVTAKPKPGTQLEAVTGGAGGSWCPVQIGTPDGESDPSYVGWIAPGAPRVLDADFRAMFPEGSPWSRL